MGCERLTPRLGCGETDPQAGVLDATSHCEIAGAHNRLL